MCRQIFDLPNEWTEFEKYKTSDNEYDLTNCSLDEVHKVFKLLKSNDDIRVVKDKELDDERHRIIINEEQYKALTKDKPKEQCIPFIILDFENVMIDQSSEKGVYSLKWDQFRRIKEIKEATGAKLIFPFSPQYFSMYVDMARKLGGQYFDYLVCENKNHTDKGMLSGEMVEYELKKHDIKNYIIITPCLDTTREPLETHVVNVDYDYGLTDTLVEVCIRTLKDNDVNHIKHYNDLSKRTEELLMK